MPRRKEVQKRQILKDPKYRDETVAKFINILMKSGKKSIAEKVMYGALGRINKDPEKAIEIFTAAIQNIKPRVEVKSRRVGGATYQVPVEVRPVRQQTLAMRWIIEAARKRRAQSMVEKLTAELTEAADGKGAAMKKREDTLKMANANKAFAHYRW